MKKYIFFIWLLLLFSCTENKDHYTPEKRIAKGNIKLGGVFHYNETEYFRSIFPQNVTEVVGHKITTQLYEGLVAFDQATLAVKPCLAERWEITENATKFIFHLRKGVYFHDDSCFENGKGRLLNAQDVAYCLRLLCTPDVNNQGFFVFKGLVKNADAYYEWSDSSNTPRPKLDGIVATDDSTIVITLERPFGGFLYRLALPFAAIFPREAYEKYGMDMREKAVGTGPFIIKKVIPDVGVFLVRNKKYWGYDTLGNQLPYLDGIRLSFMKEDKIEMMEFKKGKLDMKYRLPMDMVPEIINNKHELKEEYKNFRIQETPELATQYYGFLLPDKITGNVHLRKAFNYAIDRKKIVDYTTKGTGVVGNHGIVPLGMPGYNYAAVKGYDFDLAKAQEELALAGYPNGKNFPPLILHINSGGGRNEKIAEAVTAMLQENLNIKVSIEQALWAQHTENLETGKYQFWRLGWVADYPDPENFLNLYYGKHVPKNLTEKAYINPFRYKNPAYDALLEKALAESDDKKRNMLYEQLDQMALNDAPTLTIYYPLNITLFQPWVKNFAINGMDYRCFREVWLDK